MPIDNDERRIILNDSWRVVVEIEIWKTYVKTINPIELRFQTEKSKANRNHKIDERIWKELINLL